MFVREMEGAKREKEEKTPIKREGKVSPSTQSHLPERVLPTALRVG